jgi:methyl-accepting chemotaxis protein
MRRSASVNPLNETSSPDAAACSPALNDKATDAEKLVNGFQRSLALLPLLLAVTDLLQEELPALTGKGDRQGALEDYLTELSAQALQHRNRLEQFAEHIGTHSLDGSELSLDEFAQMLERSLNEAAERNLGLSGMALGMAASLQQATTQLANAQQLAADIRQKAQQVRLSSLNATIEAERSGDAAGAFNAAARDIKEAVQEISSLSTNLEETTSGMKASLHHTLDMLQDMATSGFSGNDLPKSQLSRFLASIRQQQHELQEAIREMGEECGAFSEHIDRVMSQPESGLQTQRTLEQCMRAIASIAGHFREVANHAPQRFSQSLSIRNVSMQYAEQLMDDIQAGKVKHQIADRLSGYGLNIPANYSRPAKRA